MKIFGLLLLCGAALAMPSDLSHLEGHRHDQHHQREAHALPVPLLRSAPEVYQEQEYQEPVGPPRPYSFTYQAGRYPGHVDRVHSESRSPGGPVVGTYEYLDPLKRVVKVDYTADENGFHPNVQGAAVPKPQKESVAVQRARDDFFTRSAAIVAEQARIGEEHARLRAIAQARRAQEEAEAAAQEQQYVRAQQQEYV